jgi:hypothetical protein
LVLGQPSGFLGNYHTTTRKGINILRKTLRIAAIVLMAIFLFSATFALAADTWTQYGKSGHSSINGDSVSFSGHPLDPFVSLLFRPTNDGDYRVLTFHLTEGNSDWHTLEGSGFLFNAGISGGNLSGCAVLFTQSEVGFLTVSILYAILYLLEHKRRCYGCCYGFFYHECGKAVAYIYARHFHCATICIQRDDYDATTDKHTIKLTHTSSEFFVH